MGKYQLPHYDRVCPGVRYAVRAGHLVHRRIEATGGVKVRTADGQVRTAWGSGTEEALLQDAAKLGADQVAVGEAHSCAATFNSPNVVASRDEFLEYEQVACNEYARYGQQVFSLSPLIQEMFLHTDLGAITIDDLKLPFDCFYVALHGADWLDGFYVNYCDGQLSFVGADFRGVANVAWDGAKPLPMGETLARGEYFRYFTALNTERWRRECPEASVEEVVALVHADPGRNEVRAGLRAKLHGADPDYLEYTSIRDIMEEARGGTGGSAEDQRVQRALSEAMTRITFSLLFYLNSDDRSVEVDTSQRDERAEAEATAESLQGRRGRRKRGRRRDAKERLRYLSGATFRHVGAAQEQEITSREGFDMTQPRQWRRGHMHRYWTKPRTINGEKIPVEEWPEKRSLKRQWTIPTLVNPDGEREDDVVHRAVVKQAQEALAAEVWTEGKEIAVPAQTRRERPGSACRAACLKHHGRVCQLCFDAGLRFGDGAKGWLHVHHLDPLGDVVAERDVDPIADMVPLCASCHGFVHSRRPALTMERAREVIEMAKAEKAAK